MGDIFLHAPNWVDAMGVVVIGTLIVGVEVITLLVWLRIVIFFGVKLLRGIKKDLALLRAV